MMGRNGSGKTTLRRTLCGIIPPLSSRCSATAIVPAMLLLSSWVLPALGIALASTIVASVLIVALTARGFRSTRVLST